MIGSSTSRAPAAAAVKPAQSKPSAKAQNNLLTLKRDVQELEDYIPWNVVVPKWSTSRSAWARKTRDCQDTSGVAKQLIVLEQAIVDHAFEEEWRQGIRARWEADLLKESCPSQVSLSFE